MSFNAVIGISVWCIVLLAVSAWVVSRKHPSEVYLVWYFHFLLLVIFVGLEIIAQSRNVSLTNICHSFKTTCGSAYGALTGIEGEAEIVTIVIAVAILPQLFAYVFSGLWGCASTPLFVVTILKLGMWSVIKFFAGFSAILFATPIAALFVGKPTTYQTFIPGLALIANAFAFGMVLVLYELAGAWLHKWLKARRGWRIARVLRKVHRCFTRNVEKPRPYHLARQALIQLLKSDAVYDYVMQHPENTKPFISAIQSQGQRLGLPPGDGSHGSPV